MTTEEFVINSLIMRVKYMYFKKKKHTKAVNKENRCINKIYVSNLLGLRDGGI